MTLLWTSGALRDLRRLHIFIARDNPDAARRAIAAIRSGVRQLITNPAIGRPAALMDLGYREWLIPFGASHYVVLYRQTDADIVLLAVRHGKELGY
jgi:plasmid stabilization system protein ParE